MTPKKIAGANAHPGAPRNWDENRDGPCGALAVRVTYNCEETLNIKWCESAWEPTAEELAALNAGGQVILRVVGWQVPVALYVEASEV